MASCTLSCLRHGSVSSSYMILLRRLYFSPASTSSVVQQRIRMQDFQTPLLTRTCNFVSMRNQPNTNQFSTNALCNTRKTAQFVFSECKFSTSNITSYSDSFSTSKSNDSSSSSSSDTDSTEDDEGQTVEENFNSVDQIRFAVLDAALDHVQELGWSTAAIAKGTK